MRNIAARDAKNRFGELLDVAQREPVAIEKHGRRVAVVLSAQDFDALEAIKEERLKAELSSGLKDLDAGRTVDGEAFLAELIGEDGP